MPPQDYDQDMPFPGLRPNHHDLPHDRQLLRDFEAGNGRMAREHGRLPSGELTRPRKRKLQALHPAIRTETLPVRQVTTDDGR